jgi:hypothetical protein
LSEKIDEKVSIDIDSTLDIADKVTDLLDTNIERPFERYLVARLISILYEETWKFSLDPKFEGEIRKLAKKNQKNINSN